MSVPPIHPEEILSEELAELGITPTELARQLRVPRNRITQIVQGKRAITGDTALRLGHWFGTGPAFWMSLQSLYDVRLAEQQAGSEVAARWHDCRDARMHTPHERREAAFDC
jgi:addiction module HigA family antidote